MYLAGRQEPLESEDRNSEAHVDFSERLLPLAAEIVGTMAFAIESS